MPTFVIDNKVETLDNTGCCPECGSSWDAGSIFDTLRRDPHYVGKTDKELRAYIQECYGDDTKHFSRLIGIEYRGKYDGVWEWQCPDCKKTWPRFLEKGGRIAR